MSDTVRFKKRSYKCCRTPYPTKLVVRRLPPQFSLEHFKKAVGILPSHNYIHFVKSYKSNQFSRLYINFLNYDDVLAFKEKYDNYVFLDSKGNEYAAVVEYAINQNISFIRLPQRDPLLGTIESDEYYIDFLKKLSSKEKQNVKTEYDFQFQDDKNSVSLTPLLKYISERKYEKLKESKEERNQKYFKKKDRDNCIVFVNSNVKRSHKYCPKYNKRKQLYAESFG